MGRINCRSSQDLQRPDKIIPVYDFFLLNDCGFFSLYFKNQLKSLQGAELKLAELQTKYSGMEKQNFELSEKVNSY